MTCPKCGSDDYCVTDSRVIGDTRHRRRKCNNCNNRFGTIEIVKERYEKLIAKEILADKFVEQYAKAEDGSPSRQGVMVW